MQTTKNNYGEQGLSLVELMVAMALGSLLLTIAIEMMLVNAKTARVQDGLAEINENGRFILEFMRQEVEMSGYSGSPFAFPVEPIDWSTTGRGVSGSRNGGESESRFDQVTFRRKLSQEGYDCLGDRVNDKHLGKTILSRFYVNRMPGDEEIYELRCEVSVEGVMTNHKVKSTALITGIESFQIQFGVVNRVGEGRGSETDRSRVYLTAEEVDPNSHYVQSVRMALLLHNTHAFPLRGDLAAVEAIEVLEQTYTQESDNIDLSDGRVRRVYETTFELKNRQPISPF